MAMSDSTESNPARKHSRAFRAVLSYAAAAGLLQGGRTVAEAVAEASARKCPARFEAVLDPADTYVIFDNDTDLPAVLVDDILWGMYQDEAEMAVVILNAMAVGQAAAA